MADVNEWDAGQKPKWIMGWLTGKAQTAFQCLPKAVKTSYNEVKKALQERFGPKSHQSHYQAEFQTHIKQKSVSWANSVDYLKTPGLPRSGRGGKGTFGCQPVPATAGTSSSHLQCQAERAAKLDDAVNATLEVEAYSLKPG